jgi:hypothetical protein
MDKNTEKTNPYEIFRNAQKHEFKCSYKNGAACHPYMYYTPGKVDNLSATLFQLCSPIGNVDEPVDNWDKLIEKRNQLCRYCLTCINYEKQHQGER